MCLIVFAYQNHPQYDLILAANRDEFYGRPTRAAQFWEDHPHLLAGKDLQAGGTWMGVNRRGQLAALTNYRDPSIQRQDPPSRGHIVLDFLKQKKDSQTFLKNLHSRAKQYMGFNLLAGTVDNLFHYSNHEETINPVASGVHGLSNALLDTPWPKVKRAKNHLKQITNGGKIKEENLFDLLKDDAQAADENLPETGITVELEKQVSPIFIKGDDYGTRCSTILLIDKQGKVTFEERRYNPGTMGVDETNRFEFEMDRR